jgi:uncharacterized protein (TIGR02145 family)
MEKYKPKFFSLIFVLISFVVLNSCERNENTVPGAPTDVVAIAGEAQATISFNAPVSNGGSDITWYKAISSPGDFTVTGSESPVTVTGLSTSITYTFTVTAKNINGYSEPSSESNPVAPFGSVMNPLTGRKWMDRNLGASRVATSSADAQAYGDLYQWGRAADGHQIRTSGTTTTLSSSDTPGHSNFILAPDDPYWDWRSPQNSNLWQGVNGVNNPCPDGYRIPTEAEWNEERLTWNSNNAAGAFASPLKLTLAGTRFLNDGQIAHVASYGAYRSSSFTYNHCRTLIFSISTAYLDTDYRAGGISVRCIKD